MNDGRFSNRNTQSLDRDSRSSIRNIASDYESENYRLEIQIVSRNGFIDSSRTNALPSHSRSTKRLSALQEAKRSSDCCNRCLHRSRRCGCKESIRPRIYRNRVTVTRRSWRHCGAVIRTWRSGRYGDRFGVAPRRFAGSFRPTRPRRLEPAGSCSPIECADEGLRGHRITRYM
jgi:hypothetical protein